MALTLPNTITSGSTADAVELQDNYVAIRDFVNGLETTQITDDAAQTVAVDGAVVTAAADATAKVAAHTSDASAAHAASAISAAAHGSISSTTVQTQLEELENEVDAVITAADTLAGRVTTAEADIVTLEPGTWTNLTLASGWTNYPDRQRAQYRRVGDIVELRGTVQHLGAPNAAWKLVLTMPSGQRIPDEDGFPGTGTGNHPGLYFHVQPGGAVRVYNIGSGGSDGSDVDVDTNPITALSLTGIRYSVTA